MRRCTVNLTSIDWVHVSLEEYFYVTFWEEINFISPLCCLFAPTPFFQTNNRVRYNLLTACGIWPLEQPS